MSNSLQQIEANDLRTRLQQGIITFFFVKKDNSLRECKGTTNLRHIPADQHPQGIRESSPAVVPFWDFLAGGWRSAKVNTLIFIKE